MTAEWVVGCDGSPGSEVALRWAASQAALRDARLRVVSVWNVPVAAADISGGPAIFVDWTDVEQAVTERVGELVKTADLGVPADIEVVQGGAAASLIDAARHSDLLVVGSRGLGGFRRVVLGSVSRQCATHAHVPTVVVPHDTAATPVRQIVVGVDGSANSEAAFRWALEFADRSAAIRVVTASELAPWTDPAEIRERFPDEVAEAERVFDQLTSRLDPDGRAERRFVLAGARQTLAEMSTDADLVVLGARGRGAVGAALLGSVTTWMLHAACCATAVVPHDDADGSGAT